MDIKIIAEFISAFAIIGSFLFSVHKIHSCYVNISYIMGEIIKSQLIKISHKTTIEYEDLDYAESLYKVYESMGKNGLGKKAIAVIRNKYYGGNANEGSTES